MPTRGLINYSESSTGAFVLQAEPTIATVFDVTSQTPAVAGKLVALVVAAANAAANSQAINYSQNAVLSAQLPRDTYGIVNVPASVQGATAQIVAGGPVQALVTTLTSQIIPGNLLQADAYGNLCSVGGTLVVGSVLGVALGTLVTATGNSGFTTSPIKIPIVVGNA